MKIYIIIKKIRPFNKDYCTDKGFLTKKEAVKFCQTNKIEDGYFSYRVIKIN